MTEDWSELLEGREVEIDNDLQPGETPRRVDVEAPAGFGRSEYKRMIEDLWSDGEVQAMTVLDRSLEFIGEASAATVESVQSMYDTTVSGDFDGEDYALGIFGTGIGTAGIGIGAASVPMLKIGKATAKNIQSPLYTSSDSVYDTEADIGEQEIATVFYTENSDGRQIRFAGAFGENPDTQVVEDGLEYLENFEA